MSKNLILSCPPIGGERIEKIKTSITQWLSVPSLHKLTEQFGGLIPDGMDICELSKWFLEFSDVWDFRGHQKQAFDRKVGEGARWLLNSDELTEGQKQSTLAAALDLGLMDNAIPAYEIYDYVWVLGGAKLSCLLRSRLAKQSIANTKQPPKAVVMLASMRPIGDGEREATDIYAPTAATEFDLFIAAAQKEFGVGDNFTEERHDYENANKSWIIRKYLAADYELFVIAAPASEPDKRRANSVDTYEFFFDRFKVDKGAEILLATSQIYVPYQHLEAVRTIAIPHRISLDTIGFVPEWGGALQGMNEPSNYLQEIRSTIQAIDRFLTQYSGTINDGESTQ
jgi:hypothetical protein